MPHQQPSKLSKGYRDTLSHDKAKEHPAPGVLPGEARNSQRTAQILGQLLCLLNHITPVGIEMEQVSLDVFHASDSNPFAFLQ